jgi:hypothetical protein
MAPDATDNSFLHKPDPKPARPAETTTPPALEKPFLIDDKPSFWSLPEMRYQNQYVWLVLVSTMDIILTKLVLEVWFGYEVNPVARAVIDHMGFIGAIGLKFGIVVFVIIVCEVIGRFRDRDGRALATGSIYISAVPVVYTFLLLLSAGPAPLELPIDADPAAQSA